MIPIPIAVIANGEGPTVFLAAGTHGDEYEGQVILRRMIHNLDPASVSGRLIIMPALNYPAVLASARISPLDDGNLARVFPGEEGASPTLSIAHFVDSKILPLCNALMDLHSGGRAADMIPQTYLCRGSDPALNARRLELLDVFAAPLTVVAGEEASPGYLDYSAAERYGIASFSNELGGGGGVDLDGLEVGTNGVNRVLHHLGVIPAPADTKSQNSRCHLWVRAICVGEWALRTLLCDGRRGESRPSRRLHSPPGRPGTATRRAEISNRRLDCRAPRSSHCKGRRLFVQCRNRCIARRHSVAADTA